jgi:hypothetical protein
MGYSDFISALVKISVIGKIAFNEPPGAEKAVVKEGKLRTIGKTITRVDT